MLTPDEEASAPDTPPSRLGQLAAQGGTLHTRVAANPSAPKRLLARLALQSEAAKPFVARNPACPRRVLYALAERHPGEVAQNPLFFWLWRGDSDAPRAPTARAARALLAWPGLSARAVEAAVTHPFRTMRLAAARSGRLSLAQCQALAGDPDENVRSALAEAPNVPVGVLERLQADPTHWVRGCLARRQGLPAHLAQRLAEDPDSWVRSMFLGSPDPVPEPLLIRALEGASEWTRESVARRVGPETPQLALLLATDPVVRVRVAVAQRVATHPAVEALVRDAEPQVREALCRSAFAQAVAGDRLARDPSPKVRYWLLMYGPPDSPRLAQLASDLDPGVRRLVASRVTSPELIARLAEDPETKGAVYSNPHAPAEVLRRLDRSANWARQTLARNLACPEEILRELASDRDQDNVGRVARRALEARAKK